MGGLFPAATASRARRSLHSFRTMSAGSNPSVADGGITCAASLLSVLLSAVVMSAKVMSASSASRLSPPVRLLANLVMVSLLEVLQLNPAKAKVESSSSYYSFKR